jgi:hypothetical protein
MAGLARGLTRPIWWTPKSCSMAFNKTTPLVLLRSSSHELGVQVPNELSIQPQCSQIVRTLNSISAAMPGPTTSATAAPFISDHVDAARQHFEHADLRPRRDMAPPDFHRGASPRGRRPHRQSASRLASETSPCRPAWLCRDAEAMGEAVHTRHEALTKRLRRPLRIERAVAHSDKCVPSVGVE